MKPLLSAILAFAGTLCLLLLPHRESSTGASPDNLWTHDGEWKRPSESPEVRWWNRTEYGLRWAWLVHDTEVNGESFYAKLAGQYLITYLLASGTAGLAVYWLSILMIQKGNRHPAAKDMDDGGQNVQ